MSQEKEMRWIDFSKIPVDTLVDVELVAVSEATRNARIYVATRFFSHVDLSDDRQEVFKCFGNDEINSDCNYPHPGTLGSRKIRISAKNPWLPWFGGECPVPENCMVETILRTKRKLKDEAWIVDWLHFEKSVEDNEVIAYRLLESPWQTIDGVCDE